VIGDRGVVQWFTRGFPRQGGHYKNRGCVIWRFEGTKIVDFQDFLDTEIVSAFFPRGVPQVPPADIEQITAKAFIPE
jgi:ketosteroid isomerase-like protein